MSLERWGQAEASLFVWFTRGNQQLSARRNFSVHHPLRLLPTDKTRLPPPARELSLNTWAPQFVSAHGAFRLRLKATSSEEPRLARPLFSPLCEGAGCEVVHGKHLPVAESYDRRTKLAAQLIHKNYPRLCAEPALTCACRGTQVSTRRQDRRPIFHSPSPDALHLEAGTANSASCILAAQLHLRFVRD